MHSEKSTCNSTFERLTRFELVWSPWKGDVLPLYDNRLHKTFHLMLLFYQKFFILQGFLINSWFLKSKPFEMNPTHLSSKNYQFFTLNSLHFTLKTWFCHPRGFQSARFSAFPAPWCCADSATVSAFSMCDRASSKAVHVRFHVHSGRKTIFYNQSQIPSGLLFGHQKLYLVPTQFYIYRI